LVRLEPLEQLVGGFTRVLRLRVHAGPRSEVVFIKAFVPANDTAEERRRQFGYLDAETERLAAAAGAFEAMPWLRVPRLIASLPEPLTIITAEMTGVRLDVVLRRALLLPTRARVAVAERALGRVGEWLREFQRRVPARDPAAARKDYRAYVDDRLQRLVAVRGWAFTEDDRASALEAFDAHVAGLAAVDWEPAPAHADLCPANVLVADDAIGVLDLAMSTDRVRTLDLAHLYFHVELLARRLPTPRRVVARLQRALLDGFSRGFDPASPLFRVMLLQHAICHLVQCASGDGARLLANRRFRRRTRWALRVAGGTPRPGAVPRQTNTHSHRASVS